MGERKLTGLADGLDTVVEERKKPRVIPRCLVQVEGVDCDEA